MQILPTSASLPILQNFRLYATNIQKDRQKL